MKKIAQSYIIVKPTANSDVDTLVVIGVLFEIKGSYHGQLAQPRPVVGAISMDTDFSTFEITEIAPSCVLSYNRVWDPAFLVLSAQPEAVYSPIIINVPCESRVDPPLPEGSLEGDCTCNLVNIHYAHQF